MNEALLIVVPLAVMLACLAVCWVVARVRGMKSRPIVKDWPREG